MTINKVAIISVIISVVNMNLVLSSNILAIFPIPYRDNQLTFVPLMKRLIENGHHLTIMTTNPNIFLNSINYENDFDLIDLSFTQNLDILKQLHQNNAAYLSESEMLRQMFRVMRTVAEVQLNSLEIQEFLRNDTSTLTTDQHFDLNNHNEKLNSLDSSNKRRFDAVLVDWSGPCLMNAFAYKFQAPLIGITPGGAYMTSHEAMGNPNHPVLFPSILMPFSENLNLFQRISSVIFSYKYRSIYFHEELPVRDEIVRKAFGPNTPSLWEIQSNADLLLINSFEALGNSRPVGPSTIYLGGIHSKSPSSPSNLPNSLKSFLDTSENPILYINLGEIVNRAFVENKLRLEKFLHVLELSSFDVIWNMNGLNRNDFNTSAKIYQNSFIDQEDVLAHSNVKLFITIGGQHDIEDAIQHKVPCLGLTFSTNIEHYLMQVIKNHAGDLVNFDEETTTELLGKIETFAITNKYKENMIKLNKLIHDQPMSSIERAIWWIEYVLRNGGTKHLKNSFHTISWFEYLLIDVILTVLIIGLILVGVMAKIIIEIRKYSNSLPYEKITRRSLMMREKMKMM